MIVNVLYLSSGTTVGSTGRILQHWLELGGRDGLCGNLVLRAGSQYVEWAHERGIHTLVDSMPWPNRRAPWQVLWHAARVARWAKRAGVEVIHCNEHDVYPFARIVNKFLRLPVVCHVRYLLQRGFAQWAFSGNRCPDALLWTSYQQRADSADAIAGLVPEEKQHVLRLGVDIADVDRYADAGRDLRRQWGVGDSEVMIGCPAPLRPRKRVEDFILAIRQLATNHPEVVGIVAGQEVPGDEEYRARIERLIAESGLGRRLRWVGYLSPIEPFHHACDISVSTSEYETFGNSVCEAMACGKPLAAYGGGSVAEVVGEAGIVVETGDVKLLVEAIESLVADRPLRIAIGEAARERVRTTFNPAQSLQQIQAIYSAITRDRKSSTGNLTHELVLKQ